MENNNISNSYANAMDLLLTDDEKIRLIDKLNETLPKHLKRAGTGAATSYEDFLNAIHHSRIQLSRIMLSSGFNPWAIMRSSGFNPWANGKIKRLNDITTFDEFIETYNKLFKWEEEYEAAIKDLYENNGS